MRGALRADGFEPATAERALTLALSDYAAFVLTPLLLARLGAEETGVYMRVRRMFGRGAAV